MVLLRELPQIETHTGQNGTFIVTFMVSSYGVPLNGPHAAETRMYGVTVMISLHGLISFQSLC